MGRRAASLVLLSPLLAACAVYDSPPVPVIDGLENGLLPNGAPLDVVFSEPIDPATLRLSLVPLVTDVEGNLADEDDKSETELEPFFSHDPPEGDTGGTGELLESNTVFRITPSKPLPVGPKLAVLIESGLADLNGNDTGVRTRLTFAYPVVAGGGTSQLTSGVYFFLFDIEKPIGVQIQILADMRIDGETGDVLAQFTSADRNKDPDRCPMPCKETEACRLLPEPACVTPSERAGSVDEYSDFVPHPDPPTGFSFTVHGSAGDLPDGSTGLVTMPTTLSVQMPPVEAVDLAITCSFKAGDDGVLRCQGNSGAKDVLIGGSSAGAATGTSTGRLVPPEEAPKDLPPPPDAK
jgi:hypothetical protein